MAIRDIVTLGFGNGTYDPGVGKLPTLGYSTGVTTPPSTPGMGFILEDNRLHFILEDNRLHFTSEGSGQ